MLFVLRAPQHERKNSRAMRFSSLGFTSIGAKFYKLLSHHCGTSRPPRGLSRKGAPVFFSAFHRLEFLHQKTSSHLMLASSVINKLGSL